jgi:hypothetical protein
LGPAGGHTRHRLCCECDIPTGRDFFNAGGLGILNSDGKLSNAAPQSRPYYSFALFRSAAITADYQFINNPIYNRAQWPVSVLGFRFHGQF